jgi:Uma2 family endonuclease
MAQAVDVKLTYQDLLAMPEDGLRHELIDGVHYVSAAPRPRHQLVLARLLGRIENYLRERPVGVLLPGPADVVFTDHDVVEPDLLFVSRARREILTELNISGGAPELMVEILSPSTRRRDLVLKHRLYERWGVDQYWIVDPQRKTVQAFRRASDRYRLAAELGAGDVLTTPILPGLEIPLAEVFADPF